MQNFAQTLAAGQAQLGLGICYPSPGAIERIGADWDWIWIDGQHGEVGYADVLALVRACDLIGRPALVRVPWHETGPIAMALDAGATGVIVPCIDTAEQARRAVDAAKFPPLGKRSYGGRRVIDRVGRGYADDANARTMLIVQIESPAAIDNLDAIAAVDGVDGLFLGPDDMLLRRGCSMQAPRTPELLRQDMDAVAAACKRHDKRSVMIGIGSEMLECCASLAVNLVVAGTDVLFLANGSRQAAAEARRVVVASSSDAPANAGAIS